MIAGIALHLGGEVVQAAHRAARRPLASERREDRRLAKRRRGPDAAGDHVEEPLGRLDAPLGHVHVRIGLVAVEQVGAADHRLREVGVEVERHRDGDPRPDLLPDGGDEVALAVVHPFGHHRPVKVEEHAREWASPAEVRQHALLHVVEDVPRHPAGRRGRRGDRRHQGEPCARRGADHAPEARSGAPEMLHDLPAVAEVPRLELPPVGRDGREGVRLVRHHRQKGVHVASLTASCGDRASRGGWSPPCKDLGWCRTTWRPGKPGSTILACRRDDRPACQLRRRPAGCPGGTRGTTSRSGVSPERWPTRPDGRAARQDRHRPRAGVPQAEGACCRDPVPSRARGPGATLPLVEPPEARPHRGHPVAGGAP